MCARASELGSPLLMAQTKLTLYLLSADSAALDDTQKMFCFGGDEETVDRHRVQRKNVDELFLRLSSRKDWGFNSLRGKKQKRKLQACRSHLRGAEWGLGGGGMEFWFG